MVNEQTRNAVWQAMLDAARLGRYCNALGDQYRRKHFIVRFTLLVAAIVETAALLALLPESVRQSTLLMIAQLIAAIAVALIVAWDFLSDYARKAAILHAINLECNSVGIALDALWGKIESEAIADDEAQRENARLARKIVEVTSWAGFADIRENLKLNQQCTEDAYKVTAARYAV